MKCTVTLRDLLTEICAPFSFVDISTIIEGWAHKVSRSNPKKTEAAKVFLKKLYDDGNLQGGKKYTGFEAANAMIEAKTEGGKRLFKAEELLRADQIATVTVAPLDAQDDSDEFEAEDEEEEIIVGDEDTGARVLRRSQRLARNALQNQAEQKIDEMYRNVERLVN
uniref:Uncharacterized protein n=1 Tax=Panagrolaimus sp. ES5 TaxID=591445 RepID=A0AC34G4M0_9BILA